MKPDRLVLIGLAALLGTAALQTTSEAGAFAPAPAAAASLKDTLTRISEEILEAIRLGDKEKLSRHLAPEMMLINRDGNVYSRSEFLDELVPPREGYDLRFRILESHVVPSVESALFTFLLDEHLAIFGHDVSTVFRNHFLLHRLNGQWKLALYTYWEKPSEPKGMPLDPRTAGAVVGTYELVPGKWVTRITSEGDSLTIQRDQGPKRQFLPIAGDRFRVPGLEAEYYFERDAAGRVTALVFRRNWIDMRMMRVH